MAFISKLAILVINLLAEAWLQPFNHDFPALETLKVTFLENPHQLKAMVGGTIQYGPCTKSCSCNKYDKYVTGLNWVFSWICGCNYHCWCCCHECSHHPAVASGKLAPTGSWVQFVGPILRSRHLSIGTLIFSVSKTISQGEYLHMVLSM